MVHGVPIIVWDSHKNKHRKVYPILVFAFADTPARRSWALTTGHTGFRGCDKCGLIGFRQVTEEVTLKWTAFAGYCNKCRAVVLPPGSEVHPELAYPCPGNSVVCAAMLAQRLRH